MSDSRADKLRKVIDRISAHLQDQYLISDRDMCNHIVKICIKAQQIDDVSRKTIAEAARALRYLADHPRPNGGEESFNAAHLFQIADELGKESI